MSEDTKEKLERKLVDLTIRLERRADTNLKKRANLQHRIDIIREKLARLNSGLYEEDLPEPKHNSMSIPYSGGMGVPKIGGNSGSEN